MRGRFEFQVVGYDGKDEIVFMALEVGNQQGWDVKYKKKWQMKQGLSGGEKVEGRALGRRLALNGKRVLYLREGNMRMGIDVN